MHYHGPPTLHHTLLIKSSNRKSATNKLLARNGSLSNAYVGNPDSSNGTSSTAIPHLSRHMAVAPEVPPERLLGKGEKVSSQRSVPEQIAFVVVGENARKS
mmetsp:Transcript_7134/g.22032  ORF Transcript_7134/g.22032 Transcript_7134/m.22032 type:complete len:101 (+) Transcript_7134:155-457(+)